MLTFFQILIKSSVYIHNNIVIGYLQVHLLILVSHIQVNPPYYLKLVEVVPSEATAPEIVTRTMDIMKSIGHEPVLVNKEVNGFLVNRLQYAVIMEAWRLVEVYN